MTDWKMPPSRLVIAEIDIGSIDDEEFIVEYWRRYPTSLQADIETLICGASVTPLPHDLLDKLIEWANEEKRRNPSSE